MNDYCDYCHEQMITVDGITGWMIPTGRLDDETGLPIVKMACRGCYRATP